MGSCWAPWPQSTFWMPLCPQALLLMLCPAAITAAYRNIDWCHHLAAARHLHCHGQDCSSQCLRATLCLGRSLLPSQLCFVHRGHGLIEATHMVFTICSEATHMVFTSLTLPWYSDEGLWSSGQVHPDTVCPLTLRQHLPMHPIFLRMRPPVSAP